VSIVPSSINFFQEYLKSSNTDFLLLLSGSIAINLFFALTLGLSGSGFLGLFPDIRYHGAGFEFRILFYKAKVDWGEVVELIGIEKTGEISALVINKRGMFFNLLYGRYLARSWKRPIVLVSRQSVGFENFKKHLEESIRNAR